MNESGNEARNEAGGQAGDGDGGAGAADADDDAPAHRQDPKFYPLGQALRATFDADNHASLSKDVTGLMLDLARVPFEPHEFEPVLRMRPPPPRPGWRARLRLGWRRLREGRR